MAITPDEAGVSTPRHPRSANAVHAGVVWVNNHMAVGPEGPLGGYKGSGYGREGGTAGLEEFTQLKQVIVNLS